MRGPGVRLDLDVRRVWKCPACQRTRRLPGDMTAVRCQCVGEPWMEIVGERVTRIREQKSAEARELTVESFQLTDEELATPLPGRVRRRGPSPRADAPCPAANPPATGSERPGAGPSVEREPQSNAPQSGPPAAGPQRRQRPPRPPRGSKKPLSEIADIPDAAAPPKDSPPQSKSLADTDEFSAGLDLTDSPPAG